MKEYGHFIAGQPAKGTSGRCGEVFDPATGEVQAKVAFASRASDEGEYAEAAGPDIDR